MELHKRSETKPNLNSGNKSLHFSRSPLAASNSCRQIIPKWRRWAVIWSATALISGFFLTTSTAANNLSTPPLNSLSTTNKNLDALEPVTLEISNANTAIVDLQSPIQIEVTADNHTNQDLNISEFQLGATSWVPITTESAVEWLTDKENYSPIFRLTQSGMPLPAKSSQKISFTINPLDLFSTKFSKQIEWGPHGLEIRGQIAKVSPASPASPASTSGATGNSDSDLGDNSQSTTELPNYISARTFLTLPPNPNDYLKPTPLTVVVPITGQNNESISSTATNSKTTDKTTSSTNNSVSSAGKNSVPSPSPVASKANSANSPQPAQTTPSTQTQPLAYTSLINKLENLSNNIFASYLVDPALFVLPTQCQEYQKKIKSPESTDLALNPQTLLPPLFSESTCQQLTKQKTQLTEQFKKIFTNSSNSQNTSDSKAGLNQDLINEPRLSLIVQHDPNLQLLAQQLEINNRSGNQHHQNKLVDYLWKSTDESRNSVAKILDPTGKKIVTLPVIALSSDNDLYGSNLMPSAVSSRNLLAIKTQNSLNTPVNGLLMGTNQLFTTPDLSYIPSAVVKQEKLTEFLPDSTLNSLLTGHLPSNKLLADGDYDSSFESNSDTKDPLESSSAPEPTIQLNDWQVASLTVAKTAIHTRQRPAWQRPLLAVLPRQADLNKGANRAFQELQKAQWVEPASINGLLKDSESENSQLVADPQEHHSLNSLETPIKETDSSKSEPAFAATFSLINQVDTLLSQVERGASGTAKPHKLTQPYYYLAAQLISANNFSANHFEQQDQTKKISDFQTAVSIANQGISVSPSSQINLLTHTANLPVHVVNRFSQAATVNLKIVSNNPILQAGKTTQLTISPGSTATALVPITASGSGDVNVNVTVLNQNRQPITNPQVIKVMVRAEWEMRGTWTVAAILLLGLVVGVGKNIAKGRRFKHDDTSTPQNSVSPAPQSDTAFNK